MKEEYKQKCIAVQWPDVDLGEVQSGGQVQENTNYVYNKT